MQLAAKRAEMANIEQTKKIIPLVTREITFGQDVCDLVFGVNVTNLDFFGSKMILSNNQSRATRWVLETCLIVGLRPLIIILITASLSSKTYNMAPSPECIELDEMWSMLVGMTLVCLNWMGLCMFGSVACNGSPVASLWVV